MQEQKTIQEFSDWLSDRLGGEIDSSYEGKTESYFFRVHIPGTRPDPVLRVMLCAFEDWSLDEIQADLESQGVIERLQRDPTMWLVYTRERVCPQSEPLFVKCDGRNYQVVRDSDHNVRVYDDSGWLLENSPQVLAVMPDSVFLSPEFPQFKYQTLILAHQQKVSRLLLQ